MAMSAVRREPVMPLGQARGTRVAVVIVDYRSGVLLQHCLAALARQTRPPNRVIIVDNAAAPGDPWPAFPASLPVEVLQPGWNTGFARGNNLALPLIADCDWLALLNPDAVPEPGWLAALLAATQRHPQAGAFGSRMYADAARTLLDGTGDVLHPSGLVWRRDHGRAAAGRRLTPDEIVSPCAAAALYRRDLFVRLGGFDEDFFCYIEDVDLGLRLRLAGYPSRYVPEAEVVHAGSAITGRKSDFSLYYGHRNLAWMFAKCFPLSLLLLLWPLHVLMQVLILASYARAGRGRVLWAAKRDALAALGRQLTKRRIIQRAHRGDAWRLLRIMRLWR